jgi:NAD(P)-dependent dehydrogenase (short-subunit alcohol dehydrogenase family)
MAVGMNRDGRVERSRISEVVVVTGASAGLGRAMAREFAGHGARLGLIARNRERLDQAVQEAAELGGEAIALPADVANQQEVEMAADEVERRFGPIDIWINDAMTTVFAPFDQISPEEYRRATEVTYLGYVWGTMAALKRMKPRNRGMIVQVGSALAYRAIPLQAPYCGAKHAIRGFTDSIRCELIHDRSRVRITMVQMPGMNTPQFDWCRTRLPNHPQPVPPIYNPEIGARAVYWAAHHHRREVYVGISTAGSIVGQKIAPGLLDRYLGRTGYGSQQTGEPVGPDRPDNLIRSVPGEFAAHGPFDERAANRSPALWLSTHRAAIAAAVLGFSVVLMGAGQFLRSWS